MKLAQSISILCVLGLAACTNGETTPSEESTSVEDSGPMASALSAAPTSVTDGATIMDGEGNVLRKGSNGFTCHSESPAMGAVCNDLTWEALFAAYMAKEPFEATSFGVSYMLAGDGNTAGVSNIDPFATKPTDDNDWIKEGPHMMLVVPNAEALDGLSTNPSDPVYVMWKGTPYQHVMVKIAEK